MASATQRLWPESESVANFPTLYIIQVAMLYKLINRRSVTKLPGQMASAVRRRRGQSAQFSVKILSSDDHYVLKRVY